VKEGGRRRSLAAWLPGIAAVMFVAGVAVILAVAVGTVGGAREAATMDDARVAASLWELTGGSADVVARLRPGGITVEAVEDGGAGPGAYAYETGALEPGVWIGVAPRQGAGWPASATALALLGALFMAAWAATRLRSPPPRRYPAAIALVATGLLVMVAAAAQRWAERELTDLSAARVAQGIGAVEIAIRAGAAPDRAARVAGLPWATSAALERPDQLWTMPREVGEAIVSSPQSGDTAPYTVEARGATYHGARLIPSPPAQDALHLVFLGYEETASPDVALAASAAGSTLLVALVLFLLPLSARPRTLRRTLSAWGFLAPAATLLLVFTFGPLLFSLWISLHEWHLVDPAHPFTGLDNYRSLLVDGDWWSAIRNTAIFTLHVPLAMAVALALALLTRGSRRAARWARLALFLPGITSVVAIAVVWKWLLNDGYGLVNRLLEGAGLGSVPWLTSPDTALGSLMLISVWMVVGYQMVVFQAGLAAIPRDWYDAARVDGAGPLQRLRHITLPGLRHTLFFVLVTSVIGSFQVFGLVYVMTEGGPLGATDVAVYHIYREAWEFLRFGSAAAMSWMLFAIVFVATWLHFRFLEGRREGRVHA